MNLRVCRINKLLRYKNVRIFFCHSHSSLQTFIDTFTNVVIIVDQYQFCTIVIDQLAPFFTDRIRHDNDRPIPLYSSYQSKTDALISTGRLDDDRVLINDALFLCVADHIISGSRFDRTAHV